MRGGTKRSADLGHGSRSIAFLDGGGELGTLIRAHDWSCTSLGSPDTWPHELRTLVGLMLASQQPMFLAWGAEHLMLYNDGYARLCRDRHPAALGRPLEEVWHDILDDLRPVIDRTFAGSAMHMDDIAFVTHAAAGRRRPISASPTRRCATSKG